MCELCDFQGRLVLEFPSYMYMFPLCLCNIYHCYLLWFVFVTDEEEPSDGKIVFKKPERKRKTEDSNSGMDASTKRTKSNKPARRNSASKKVKDSNLLSFDEENDETFD